MRARERVKEKLVRMCEDEQRDKDMARTGEVVAVVQQGEGRGRARLLTL